MLLRLTLWLSLLLQADAFVVGPKPQPRRALFSLPTADTFRQDETPNFFEATSTVDKDMKEISHEPKFHRKPLNEKEPTKTVRPTIKAKEEPKRGYMESLFRDLMFALAPPNPNAMPTGYPGEVGDGPYDAYDVLAPKKWKP
mmetsp:Transcript_2584/g.3771  ORF Transcript_2584/g.3771 Transcript_2584/m.3771 type:complete len:142 (+) Transcript_2584:77-502(+)|eukprot:CAMPEP_0118701524 /NCGR_PEP_ID=MMETSP0800-20121206/17304_1 /TAXON_ID=210618 ORGANISM="Striatella unipunctata, Strain CCMP2910" /NCGR_SAMPLE_ID=MMETSP0800 /ASSEMBLY_ACC=CAM_ASM_000638 /LENGTH=141 /DNA_ID=CAMNT_0006602465 /DNA_START=29 /DNA_END=454 /DNA_ORIENTATION=-